ncbi:uncharacterized protein CLUP02_00449 [Colletotrichum lupini]|uniref:Uncharacterized protein n=1 Tax=Colletotrichum lupini TaxID=145971 RepID=A0A9Q8SC50_9PEZI|nr:uncharacterized protein CLUP02_00449 [Colletotrichum lupini]UQC73802.1 hypothetical protein CLUP02_00449 [Colletotrichum lupini]
MARTESRILKLHRLNRLLHTLIGADGRWEIPTSLFQLMVRIQIELLNPSGFSNTRLSYLRRQPRMRPICAVRMKKASKVEYQALPRSISLAFDLRASVKGCLIWPDSARFGRSTGNLDLAGAMPTPASLGRVRPAGIIDIRHHASLGALKPPETCKKTHSMRFVPTALRRRQTKGMFVFENEDPAAGLVVPRRVRQKRSRVWLDVAERPWASANSPRPASGLHFDILFPVSSSLKESFDDESASRGAVSQSDQQVLQVTRQTTPPISKTSNILVFESCLQAGLDRTNDKLGDLQPPRVTFRGRSPRSQRPSRGLALFVISLRILGGPLRKANPEPVRSAQGRPRNTQTNRAE